MVICGIYVRNNHCLREDVDPLQNPFPIVHSHNPPYCTQRSKHLLIRSQLLGHGQVFRNGQSTQIQHSRFSI
jgi:hypothetical protein